MFILIFKFATALSATFASWAIVDFIKKAKMANQRAREEIIITETESSFFRALMPIARGIGRYLRGTFASPDSSTGAYNKFSLKIKAKLMSAGNPEGIDEDEYVGFAVINIFICSIFGVIAFILLELFDVYIMFAIGCALGALKMPLWIKAKAEKRHTLIRKELPFALDLLTLAMEAGLDFTTALDKIVKNLKNSPLGQEFGIMLREITLGKSRSNAMRDLARRVDITEVQSVMTSLVQAEEMGASIAPILRIQSEQQRERRSQRAEEIAGAAPVKMLFPLVLIMGVTVIVIFGPMILGFLG